MRINAFEDSMEWLNEVKPLSAIDVRLNAQEARLKTLREVIQSREGDSKKELLDAAESRYNTKMNTVIFDIH